MSTTTAPAAMGTSSPRPTSGGWWAVISVTLGIFTIVTTEIMPVGLLPSIAADFHITDGVAGLTMTVPAIVAAISAVVVTVATGRLDRRFMLCALTGLLVLANLLAAVSPSFEIMLCARFLLGLTIGGFWSIGASLAARLVPAGSASTATAVIFAAVPLGSVLGVPAGTMIGHLAGWRTAFFAGAGLTVVALIALAVFVPALPPQQTTQPQVLLNLLRIKGFRAGLIATFFIVTAHFSTYTYVTTFLEQVPHINPGRISTVLLAYGLAGVVGNFAAGATIPRRLRLTFLVSAGLIATAMLLLTVLGGDKPTSVGLLLLWGAAYGTVPACCLTWLSRSAPHAPEAAAVLFTASFQATFSLGALLGGVVVDSASVTAALWCGGGLAILAAASIAMPTGRHGVTGHDSPATSGS